MCERRRSQPYDKDLWKGEVSSKEMWETWVTVSANEMRDTCSPEAVASASADLSLDSESEPCGVKVCNRTGGRIALNGNAELRELTAMELCRMAVNLAPAADRLFHFDMVHTRLSTISD